MYKTFEMELAGRPLKVDVGRVAKQANGAVLMHYGDTTVLCTATASEKPRDGIDFFPLSVEYNERMYAVGKIPGGFNKREGKASENAILTCRVIDRPMRPLFPKDYRNDVTLENLVLSVDQDCAPELTAMLGAAIATTISDIPFDGPISTTQVGLVDGEFVFNPTAAQRAVSDMALTVASTREKVIMIEAGANEVPEQQMIDAIFAAHELNQKVIAFIDTIVAECGKPKHEYESCAVPEELFAAIKEIVTPEEMEVAVFSDDKQTREENIRAVTEKLEEAFAENEEWLAVLPEAVYQYQKKTVRKMILKDHKRPDGRAINQIRPLAAEVDLIPRVHGSAMFTRGQTQICDVVTLAPLSEVQKIDGLDANITTKRYIHQYNFPAYSVGETKVSRGPGNFVTLEEEVTVDINGTEKTYPAGTYYGQIVQDQIDADGVKITVWDPTANEGAGSSDGYDGWYNADNSWEEMSQAVEELVADGLTIDADNPIQMDVVYASSSEVFTNRANSLKQSIEASTQGLVQVNLIAAADNTDWYYSGYYMNYGYEMNYDFCDLSGWGPDYGDPASYLDTFQPEYAGYMIKSIVIY